MFRHMSETITSDVFTDCNKTTKNKKQNKNKNNKQNKQQTNKQWKMYLNIFSIMFLYYLR